MIAGSRTTIIQIPKLDSCIEETTQNHYMYGDINEGNASTI